MTAGNKRKAQTHLEIDRRLCGEPVEIGSGRARVDWSALPEMVADELGLVHGGFVFGLADYAAMLAVNEPTVVLVSAESRFTRPVRIGDRLSASAEVRESEGAKHRVEVTVRRGAEVVMDGVFRCVVTRQHVLERVP